MSKVNNFFQSKGWIRTHSGRKIDIFNPNPNDIVIEDIAHSLSRLCRFNGHVKVPHYSVAQHCVIVSYLVNPEYALEAEMHDAAESITGDCITPIKKVLKQFYDIEASNEAAIRCRFALRNSIRCQKAVKRADQIALITEARDLLKHGDSLWTFTHNLKPHPEKIVALSQKKAEKLFLDRFYQLCNERGFVYK